MLVDCRYSQVRCAQWTTDRIGGPVEKTKLKCTETEEPSGKWQHMLLPAGPWVSANVKRQLAAKVAATANERVHGPLAAATFRSPGGLCGSSLFCLNYVSLNLG